MENTTASASGAPPATDEGFHYIVVGSGAGGAPLAARLALAGHRVLVLEAGADHSTEPPHTPAREVSQVPSLHGVSTEHPALSWEFFVKHYEDANRPFGIDPKEHDGKGDPEKQGIFYPRAAALGGCTVHNALITIAGPDNDWDDLADFLDDPTWKSQKMRTYFERLERNQYLPRPEKIPRGALRSFWHNVRWLLDWRFFYRGWLRAPDYAAGRHGFDGWLHTSVTKLSIGLSDWQLVRMLLGALNQSSHSLLNRSGTWVTTILRGEIKEALDPNHARTQAEHPAGIAMVPLAVCGEATTIHQNSETPNVQRGRRSSPREFLLEVKARYPDLLEIRTHCFVRRVLFAAEGGADETKKPRAIGVEYLEGERLYHAHPDYQKNPDLSKVRRVFVAERGEVILSGGSFNTPQLLMLSGIGDEEHLDIIAKTAGDENACTLRDREGNALTTNGPRRIHLPAVGTNLQDRYEVTVISEMNHSFKLLENATFRLPTGNDGPDLDLKEWRKLGTGLYTSNGAVLGIFKRSQPELLKPDLFIFGVPLPFKGYEVGYSAVGDVHNRFTWAILKGNTRNHDGTVRLRNADPLSTPLIHFHYFNETSLPGNSANDPDLAALVDGVKFVRGIARRAWFSVRGEAHPGITDVPVGDDAQLKNFIRRVAWGHHATGTCRMGPENDQNAVLSSDFRVRKVAGLRVVDASVFPKIPGYFIVTNVYMASEKAADVILQQAKIPVPGKTVETWPQAPGYPAELFKTEVEAINARRRRLPRFGAEQNEEASATAPPPPVAEAAKQSGVLDAAAQNWDKSVTGLALSGGGIRSATFNLGVLQALAGGKNLRRIDFLSTVSGGGYIGTFLGRAFDRFRTAPLAPGKRPSAAQQVEDDLTKPDSREIDWLRKYANYIAPAAGDLRLDLALFVRNLISVHFVVGLLCLACFGLLNGVRYSFLDPSLTGFSFFAFSKSDWPVTHLVAAVLGPFYSPWFVLLEFLLLVTVLPRMMGFWLVSQEKPGRYNPTTLTLNLVLVAALFFLGVRDGIALEPLILGFSLLLSFVAVELAWRRGRRREEAVGIGDVSTQRLRVRNELTYDLGLGLVMTGFALAFALIDTLGHALQQSLIEHNKTYTAAFATILGMLMALAPVAQMLAKSLTRPPKAGPPSAIGQLIKSQVTAGLFALVLLAVPLVTYSFTVHAVYQGGEAIEAGWLATGLALLLSFILTSRQAVVFVNRSSLSHTYSSRLARTFLGATNPQRHHPSGQDVTEVMAGDDVSALTDYRPHETGGPLHLLNLTVNQTIDFSSRRGNRYRKGDPMAVSCLGLSIGTRYHALWQARCSRNTSSLAPATAGVAPIGVPPEGDHPLLDEAGHAARAVEMLPLREWMAISGAAVGPSRGYNTELGTALLCGLANLRTGYWWNSGLSDAARDGFPSHTFARRLLYLAPRLFRTQALLIAEWIGRFPGPWERYWNLSDGGFSEVTGAYELIRRRTPRIIVGDATEDPNYEFEGLANLIRLVRIDFGANIEFIPEELLGHPPADDAGRVAAAKAVVPPVMQRGAASAQSMAQVTAQQTYLRVPDSVKRYLGTLDDLKSTYDADGKVKAHSRKHAALFWVVYPDHTRSLLLYLKSSVTGDESRDVIQYQDTHTEFPQESTEDQFFNEPQWESYRRLGEHAATPLFASGDWFWKVPV